MASRFVLTAQVQLQAPTNARQVVNQIQQQLRGVNVQVNLQGGQQAANQVNNITKATKQATTQAQKMGKAFGTSIRRFSAFSIASRGISLLTSGLANATKEAIDFEREMIKISQVTGKTLGQLKGLESTITNLATSFGVSSKSILSVGRILAQAGIQARDLDVALTTLAKTELAPTFDDITKTAEGAVAILAQFGEGVGALERQLGAINRVAGQFAVESGDLISVIRRTGGVFKAAGGDLEELIALFTSVRATTRESAESIATGLRTIFTRIQRPATIDFLKEFGVQLTDLNGKFVGPYEAIRQLSLALSGLEEGDIRFVKIAEELGGFRQIGKVIPLLQQFEVAERARQAALEGGTSLDDDAAKAQKALAVQIAKTKEEFLALVRSLTQTSSFQLFIKSSLELASALIRVADALKPVIPLLAGFAAISFARGAAGFARGIGAGLKGAKGFNTGGMVPGIGNRDTVPAMLTPGEFVIRKSSVQSIGAGNLAAMNARGYNSGGLVDKDVRSYRGTSAYTIPSKYTFSKDQGAPFKEDLNRFNPTDRILFRRGKDINVDVNTLYPTQKMRETDPLYNEYVKNVRNGNYLGRGRAFEKILQNKLKVVLANKASSRLDGLFRGRPVEIKSRDDYISNEELGQKVAGAAVTRSPSNVDQIIAKRLDATQLTNVKKTGRPDTINLGATSLIADVTNLSVISGRGSNFRLGQKDRPEGTSGSPLSKKNLRRLAGLTRRNSGGGISGSDTVPAMLTPGEFVFSKSAAQSIGYSNLSRMNTQGVQGFAKGGIVGFQHFQNGATGSGVKPAASAGSVGVLESRAKNLAAAFDKQANLLKKSETKLVVYGREVEYYNKIQNKDSATIQKIVEKKKQIEAEETKYLDIAKKVNRVELLQYKTDEKLIQARESAAKAAQRSAQQADRAAKNTPLNRFRNENPSTSLPKRPAPIPTLGDEMVPVDKQAIKNRREAAAKKVRRDILGGGSEYKMVTPDPPEKRAARQTSAAMQVARQKSEAQQAQQKINAQRMKNQMLYGSSGAPSKTQTQGKTSVPAKKCDICAYLSKILGRLDKMNRELRTFGKNFNQLARLLAKRGFGSAPAGSAPAGSAPSNQRRIVPLPVIQPGQIPGGRNNTPNNPADPPQRSKMDTFAMMSALTSVVALIPDFEDADEGLRAVANQSKVAAIQISAVIFALQAFGLELQKQNIGQMLSGGIGGAAKALGKLALVAGVAALSTNALAKVVDSYFGVQAKAKKAEEEAVKNASATNDKKAEEAAAAAASANSMNKVAAGVAVAGAGIGFLLGGPFGAAIGGAIGGLTGLALKIADSNGLFGSLLGPLKNFMVSIGLAPSPSQVKAQTAYTIASARAQKILAESAKDAAEELKEIQAGNVTATASLGSGGAAARGARAIGEQRAAAQRLARANDEQFRRTESTVLGRAVNFFTGAEAKNQAEKERLEKEQVKAGQDFIASQGARFAAATKEQVVAAAAAGGTTTFDDFYNSLDPSIRAVIENTDKMNGNSDEMDKLKKNFENQKKAVIENIKFIKAMNFGLSEVTSGIKAYSSSLNNLVAAQETGFSTAAFAAETLGAAISSAGKFISDAELGQSLNALEDNLKRFGANAEQITDARALITGLNDLQKSAADALLAVKAGFKGGSTSPEVIKNQLRDAIVGSIPDSSPIKQKLIDSFGKLELPPEAIQEFLNTGDVSVILDKAFGPIQEQVQKQLLGPLQEMAKQEQILVGLTKARRDAEKKLISVQKQAIDTQIEAAKAFEEFGGKAFTPERELAARRQQANLALRDAGVSGLTGGSAGEIRQIRDQIMSSFSFQQQLQNAAASGGGGAFGGAAGVDRDRREELKTANEALINFTKQGIEARKKELELIKKKNEAEKQALDSLLTGDIESFFDQAIGAAAGSALRSGNAAVAGLFGAGALGKGLQGLQGTGLTDAQNKRAAQLTFGAFGLGENAARVFTGTTREEERIKAQGRELALMQGELASQSAEMEEMTVQAKEVVISAANVRLTEIGQQVSSAQAALNFNRGGTVYASRGMFIPRGTDTVPAMLTPGEFVVNRSAVQRGNNLQILRAMNSNSAPIQAAQGFSGGGAVRYRAGGSIGPEPGGGGIDFSKFEDLVNKFQEVTDKLGNVNIKHMFDKLGTLDINHMFNGNMQQALKDEILTEAGNMMARSKFNNDGSITTSDRSVLG